MPTVILSPHLDDAVLSCWHVLMGPGEVEVINVFAGVPAGLGAPAWWDRYTGATDSSERVRERVEEDQRALTLAGRTAVNLSFLDEQYRTEEQPLAPVTAEIEPLLVPGTRVYAPVAFANHPDHAVVRSAALGLRTRGFDVSLYADLPHATLQGLPAWIRGGRGPASKDLAAAAWDRWLARTGIPREDMTPSVHELDAEALARKLEALRMYDSQWEALEQLAGRPLTDHDTLGYEVAWATPLPVRAGDRPNVHR